MSDDIDEEVRPKSKAVYRPMRLARHDHVGSMRWDHPTSATKANCEACGQRWRLHSTLGWVPIPYRGKGPAVTVPVKVPIEWAD